MSFLTWAKSTATAATRGILSQKKSMAQWPSLPGARTSRCVTTRCWRIRDSRSARSQSAGLRFIDAPFARPLTSLHTLATQASSPRSADGFSTAAPPAPTPAVPPAVITKLDHGRLLVFSGRPTDESNEPVPLRKRVYIPSDAHARNLDDPDATWVPHLALIAMDDKEQRRAHPSCGDAACELDAHSHELLRRTTFED